MEKTASHYDQIKADEDGLIDFKIKEVHCSSGVSQREPQASPAQMLTSTNEPTSSGKETQGYNVSEFASAYFSFQ